MTTHRRAPAARNYGAKDSGGDAYAMGRALNEEIVMVWRLMKDSRKQRDKRPVDALTPYFREHAYAEREWLKALLRIRHAARTSS